MNYTQRNFNLQATVEVGFQDYAVKTISKDDSAYANATPTISGFYAEFVRLLNTSDYDAYVKINEKDAFILPAGDIMNINFDAITKVEIKSAEAGQTTTVEVAIFGRTDLEM